MVHTVTGEQVSFDTSLAGIIDHTLLQPEATTQDIEQHCSEAASFGFASVCVNPSYVGMCADRLKGTGVRVCAVVGFPLGATSTQVKAFEAERAIEDGAREVDMVVNIGMLKSGAERYVADDILAVVTVAKQRGALVKVILETSLLSDEQKVKGCILAKEAGADFVKTSTGFSSGGATEHDVRLIRSVVGNSIGVKASGGIRTHSQAQALVQAGATRIGASLSVQIVTRQNDSTATGY